MKLCGIFLWFAIGGQCLLQCSAASVGGSIPQDLLETLNLNDDKIVEEAVIPPVSDFEDPQPIEDVFIQESKEDILVPKPRDESNESLVEDVVPSTSRAECRINVSNGLASPQPVFLKTDSSEFYPYSDTGVMEVDAGATMQLWCSSEFKSFASKLITATCVGGTTFKVSGTSYDFKEFTCKFWSGFVAKKTGETCNGGVMIRVGFEISASRFAKQMEICFNENEEVTRYVHHSLNPGSNYYQIGVGRIGFQTAGFFGGKNVDRLYTQNKQKETITAELGVSGDKYFYNSKNFFLARGHMAAKADFVYADQQRSTFLFINAAPQWQVFNAGNWQRVEDSLRVWVSKNKMHVECYSGVWGVTTLPNNKGVDTPLYLAYDYNNNGQIPVPKLYFRIVIEPKTEKGIVLIGVNNPYLSLEQIKRDYIICPDISDKVTYINWKKTDITAGYSYACEVGEFRKRVSHLPALNAPGGLLI